MAAEITVNITQGQIIVSDMNRGYSGVSGFSGRSGFSGANPGASGTSGTSGQSGFSGRSGFSGASGVGTSGFSGRSGYSGVSGTTGISGTTGVSGTSGKSGTTGASGTSGISGGGVSSATGTANQVLVNGTSASSQTGACTFTTPQSIGTGSTVQFAKAGIGQANALGELWVHSATNTNLTVRDGGGGVIDITAINDALNAFTALQYEASTHKFIEGGIQVNAPTGGDKGAGTINAAGAYYANGTVGASAGSFSVITAITATNGLVTQLTGTSDERLKDVDGEFSRGLAEILQIDPIRFQWNKTFLEHFSQEVSPPMIGVTAQAIQKIMPEAIGVEKWNDESEWLTLNKDAILWALVNAVKTLAAQHQELLDLIKK